jgi:ABC-type antimicrobial peptide transport system permease subunit
MTLTAAGRPWTPHDVAFVVRAAGDRSPSAATIEDAVRSAAPTVPVYRTIPLSALQAEASARTTFTLVVLAAAALLALAIGAVGLYGVTAYVVGLQTRELGVRMALGAAPSDVRRLVLQRAFRDTAIGLVAGLIGAVLLGRAIAAGLYGIAPTDPAVLAGASLLLIATTLVATLPPARRASRLDPASTLRAE